MKRDRIASGLISVKELSQLRANNSIMVRLLFHIPVLCALLVLGLATAFGVAPAQASPAARSWQIATATSQHTDAAAHSPDIQEGCDEGGCKATHGNCCLPACGTHSCGFNAIEASAFVPVTFGFILAKWRVPSEETVTGLAPQGDPRPPRHFG